MKQRLIFEWKTFLTVKNIILIVLLSATFFLSFVSLFFSNFNNNESLIPVLEEDIRVNSKGLEEQKEEARNAKDEVWLKSLENTEKINEISSQQITALRREDWSEFYTLEQKRAKLLFAEGGANTGDGLEYLKQKDPKRYLASKKDLEQRKYMVDKKIPITEDLAMPKSSWGALSIDLATFSSFILIMLFAILFCDFLTNNFEKSTIYLYSFTVKKKRSILSFKLIVQFLVAVVVSSVAFPLMFFIKGMIAGFGVSQVPVAIGNNVDNLSFISALQLLLMYIPYYFIVLLFLIILFLFLGSYLQKTLLSLGIFLLSYYGFTLIKDMDFMKMISPFVPYSYLDTFGVITQTDLYFPKHSFVIGMIYLLLLSGILYALTARRMNKLEI
ncbi:hypothetical protein SAMN02745116_01806 [Pilibacter termitis]|uniref:ABC-2 type transport system permease protein n=1 Tax=Pilibacter termitis TaxID=263852 RepID=A0A1T4PIR5_9ENTE|nr:hypothetical protein [Pilibacter termitis]SJZ91291.1 hypothetical protein SAMN02745116_01806 [Pilibacter termitis]